MANIPFLNNAYFAAKVGIGTDSPGAIFDIKGNTTTWAGMAKVFLTDTASNSNSRNFSIGNGGTDFGHLSFIVSNAKNGVPADSTGTAIMDLDGINKRVGIGTNSPTVALQLGNSTLGQTQLAIFNSEGGGEVGLTIQSRTNRAKLRVADNDSNAYVVAEAGKSFFGTSANGDATNITVLTSGNVGIGTTSPSVKLSVEKPNVVNTAVDVLKLGDDTNGLVFKSFFDASGIAWRLNKGLSGINMMTFTQPGNVGIGTTSPSLKLHVKNDNDYAAKFGGTGGGDYSIEIGQTGTNSSAGFNATGTGGSMLFKIADSEAMRINNAGNLGIGLTSPGAKLDVLNEARVSFANANQYTLRITNTDGNPRILADGSAAHLIFGTTPNGSTTAIERMRIQNDGKVGIGTTLPATQLNVVDSTALTAQFSGYSFASAANNARAASGSLRLGDGSGSTGLLIDYTDQGQTLALIKNLYTVNVLSELRLQSPFISLYTGTTAAEKMRITPAGGVSFGSTGTAYGTSGQVLTSAGNASPTWTTPTTGTVTGTGVAGRVTFWTGTNTVDSNGAFTWDNTNKFLGISHWTTVTATPAVLLHLFGKDNNIDVPQIRIEGRENPGDTRMDIAVKDASVRFNLVEGPSGDVNAGYGKMIFKTNANPSASFPTRGGFLFEVGETTVINALTITNQGNVGIGATNPAFPLEVENASTAYIFSETTGAATSSGYRWKTTTSEFAWFSTSGTNAMALYDYVANAERMRIDSSGNVLVNKTSSTGDVFQVQGRDQVFASRLDGSTTTGQSYGLRVRAGTNSVDTSMLVENTSGTDLFEIKGTGNATFAGDVAISNATPALTLTDTDNSSNIVFSSVGGALIVNSASDQIYQIGSTEYFRIATTGATFAGTVRAEGRFDLQDGTSVFQLRNTSGAFDIRNGNTGVIPLAIDSSSNATFTNKVTSTSATIGTDNNATLTTKGYVDGLVTGVPVYRGTWDASGTAGGTPDLRLAANKVLGNYYIVSTAGSATPNGAGTEPDSWNVGDWCIFSDVTPGAGTDLWQKIDNTSVISGAGTGQKVTKWDGTSGAASETLTDGPITFSTNDSTFAGNVNPSGSIRIAGGSDQGSQLCLFADSGGGTSLAGFDFEINTGGNNSRTRAFFINSSKNATFAATSSALTVIARDNLFVGTGQLYIGAENSTTDNTFRQVVNTSAGGFRLQKRISGTFTDVLSFNNSNNATFAGTVTAASGTFTNLTDTFFPVAGTGGLLGNSILYKLNFNAIGLDTTGRQFYGNNFVSISNSVPINIIAGLTSSVNLKGNSADILVAKTGGNVNIPNGNLGIGMTTSPSNRLEIEASSAITDQIILRLSGGRTGFNAANDANIEQSMIFDACAFKSSTGIVQRDAAKIAIEKDGSWNEADVGTGTRASLFFSTNNGTIDSPALAERMRIRYDGNVGIGTDSPQSKLQVAGGIQMADDTDAGTTAAKAGTMRYRTGTEYVETTGTELVTNGDFATDTNWLKTTSQWTISGGKANFAGSSTAALYQGITLTNAVTYRVRFNISGSSGSGAFIWIGNSQGSVNYLGGDYKYYADGNFEEIFTMPSQQTTLAFYSQAASSSFSMDNVTLLEVTAEDASYADMCMQTGSATYEWVNIVRNTY